MSTHSEKFGRYGIWSLELRLGEMKAAQDGAAELESLGFKTIWVPGGNGGDILERVENFLAVTKTATIATGIINIWRHEPEEIGAWWRGLPDASKERLLLGFGVSHTLLIGDRYAKPYSAMKAYLDGLDEEGVPVEKRCLAALGPKMVQLAAARSLGAHPYLITPEHTAEARDLLGPKALLAPEQGVILETDPTKAYADARAALELYLKMENYKNNWLRLGFTEDDFANGGSDALCDAMFPRGVSQIVSRANLHFDAGADHVCFQPVGGGIAKTDVEGRRPDWRILAKSLFA
jgi:probable F420-dependent oxidoreductase